MSPLCESYVPAEQLDEMEPFYPLHVCVCDRVFPGAARGSTSAPEEIFTRIRLLLVVLRQLGGARRGATRTMITERLGLGSDSLVVEMASNDGYLLQHFVQEGIPVLGIEPAANVAKAAREEGHPHRW